MLELFYSYFDINNVFIFLIFSFLLIGWSIGFLLIVGSMGKMEKLKLLIHQIYLFWPILIPALLMIAHIAAQQYFKINLDNEIIALVLQIGGGMLVLYSINSNLVIIKGGSLFGILKSWILTHNITLEVHGSIHEHVTTNVKTRVYCAPSNIYEHLEYLEKKIIWLKEDLSEEVQSIKKLIVRISSRSDKNMEEIRSKLNIIDKKLSDVSIGGVKPQIFGFLLMVHGSFISYFT